MVMHELSFAPDRRSVQTTFYHFSERPSGEFDRRGFSQHDSLAWAIDKIYQTKFAGIPKDFRDTLVNILVTEVPLEHRNLTFLATANFIVYHMRLSRSELDSKNFDAYFNFVAPFLMADVTGKKSEEIQQVRANFKTTLLRYIIYVRDNTTDFAKRE